MVRQAPAKRDVKTEEKLIPFVRARLAEKLVQKGFRTKEIASGLNLTPAAVSQYVKGRRGSDNLNLGNADIVIDPLADKVANRIRSGLGGVETIELLEAASQLKVIQTGKTTLEARPPSKELAESLKILRVRLGLELSASERYLELANKAEDDYLKLLLRMIASDSMRHADIVSQVASWLERSDTASYQALSEDILRGMREIEDTAGESSLRKAIEVDHPVARLLLSWIDMDEKKHGRMVSNLGDPKRARKTKKALD